MRRSFWLASGWWLAVVAWLNASHYLPWANFQSEWLALLGLVVMLTAVASRGEDWQMPRACVPVMLLCLVPLAQFAAGLLPFAGEAWVAVGYLLALAGAMSLGYRATMQDRPVAFPLGAIVWLPALLTAVIGLLQWLGYTWPLGTFAVHPDIGDRPMGNMAQPNQFATLLLMGAAALWFDYERGSLRGSVTGLAAGFCIALALLSQSRTALLSMAAIGFYGILKTLTGRTRLSAKALAVAAAVVIAGALAVKPINEVLLLAGNRGLAIGDLNTREVLWRQIISGIQAHPWVGYGWNQTHAAQVVGSAEHAGTMVIVYAHNLLLDLLAWCGVPLGLLVFASLALWLARRSVQANTGPAVAACAVLFPFSVHSLLEFPFAYSYFLIAAGLCAGCIEALVVPGHTIQVSRRLVASTAVMGFCALVLASFDYIRAEEDFRTLRFRNQRIGRPPEAYQEPAIHMLTQLRGFLDAVRIVPRKSMPDEEMELLRTVSARVPYPRLSYHYALALAYQGRTKDAEAQFKSLGRLYGALYLRRIASEYVRTREEDDPTLPELDLRAP